MKHFQLLKFCSFVIFIVNSFATDALLVNLDFINGSPINTKQNDNWSYNDVNLWGSTYRTCNGYFQSPINLIRNTFVGLIKPLKFSYYDIPLTGVLKNNGHTIQLDIMPLKAEENKYPSVRDPVSNNRFRVLNVHFHWGDKFTKGSEHGIYGRRFDGEMHIVHRNEKYRTTDEAAKHKDGLLVLGIFLDEETNFIFNSTGLELVIFNRVPEVQNYNTSVLLNRTFRMDQITEKINLKNYYKYQGSLTTPPCSEAVTWFVYEKPIKIKSSNIDLLRQIRKNDNKQLVNNFRPLQNINKRKIYYRLVNK